MILAGRVISLHSAGNTSLRSIADEGPGALRSVQIFRLVLLIQVGINKTDTALLPAGSIMAQGQRASLFAGPPGRQRL